ncbi:hypothetical protein FA13DRAFT_1745773 [Coprinellus micaceus]|uniref:BTB domain-containing protein n=1 Tax=Coprinellus micaceus TaxID=71717 RepID=A0A4Y7SAG1_COPMI|nr:hypothetical protein FA13DRAFT_1745773 [Coprinellus micaceus]
MRLPLSLLLFFLSCLRSLSAQPLTLSFYDVVTLKVENKLYRVPRHHLETWSQVFRRHGTSEDNPIVLSGCTSKEFENLMEVILTPTLIEPVILSKEGWVAVLKLSTMWDMPKVRKLAIEKLSSFGRTYKVRRWFLSGCQSLVEDRDPNSGLDSLALLPASGHSSVLTSTSPKQLNWMEYTKPSRPAMNSMVPAAMYLSTCICPKPGCAVGIRFEKKDYNIKMELPASTILTSKPLDTGAAIVGRTFAEDPRASLASPNAM